MKARGSTLHSSASASKPRSACAARLFGRTPDEAERLVHGESDGLPGLIVDRYADVVVLQISSAGCHRWRDAIIESLQQITAARAIYERSDADVLELEGLAPRTGLAKGMLDTPVVEIRENGIRLRVDVAKGHKTGFYLDQRDNRVAGRPACRWQGRTQLFQLYGRIHAAGAGTRCRVGDFRGLVRGRIAACARTCASEQPSRGSL